MQGPKPLRSLRARLVAGLLALTVVGLAASGAGIYKALSDYLRHRLDSQLSDSRSAVYNELASGRAFGRRLPSGRHGHPQRHVRRAAARVQRRRPVPAEEGQPIPAAAQPTRRRRAVLDGGIQERRSPLPGAGHLQRGRHDVVRRLPHDRTRTDTAPAGRHRDGGRLRRPPVPGPAVAGGRPARPAATGTHRRHRRRHRRRRPLPAGRARRARHRDRPARAGPQRHAGPDRDGLRRALRLRGPIAPLRRRRLPRAAHAADRHPGLRRIVPPGGGRAAGGPGPGHAPHRGRGRPHGRCSSRTCCSWPGSTRAALSSAAPSIWWPWPATPWPTCRPSPRTGPSRSSIPTRLVVSGDEARLRQVAGNLVANARIHTPEGTGVHVRVRSHDGQAILEVADDGPGLPPGEENLVFERFYRADAARARTGGDGRARASACRSSPPSSPPTAAASTPVLRRAAAGPTSWSPCPSLPHRPAPPPAAEDVSAAPAGSKTPPADVLPPETWAPPSEPPPDDTWAPPPAAQ